jgi:antitoxin MazE
LLHACARAEYTLMSSEIKLITIGNSKGVRIPKALLLKYGLKENIILEEREEGLLIHAKDTNRMSWEETYKATSKEDEDWSDWLTIDDDNDL